MLVFTEENFKLKLFRKKVLSVTLGPEVGRNNFPLKTVPEIPLQTSADGTGNPTANLCNECTWPISTTFNEKKYTSFCRM